MFQIGADIFLCYRKSHNRTTYLSYNASILDQYPMNSREGRLPVPENLALFCLPMGAALESWPPEAVPPDPVFSTFVLTIQTNTCDSGVHKLYGAAITFYERLV